MRGYFLVFMLLNHLAFTGGLWLVRVNHAELGFVQDAQGFIFLSGLLVGLTYTRHFLRGEPAAATGRILRRALQLHAYAMGVAPVGYANGDSLMIAATPSVPNATLASGQNVVVDYSVTGITCKVKPA